MNMLFLFLFHQSFINNYGISVLKVPLNPFNVQLILCLHSNNFTLILLGTYVPFHSTFSQCSLMWVSAMLCWEHMLIKSSSTGGIVASWNFLCLSFSLTSSNCTLISYTYLKPSFFYFLMTDDYLNIICHCDGSSLVEHLE